MPSRNSVNFGLFFANRSSKFHGFRTEIRHNNFWKKFDKNDHSERTSSKQSSLSQFSSVSAQVSGLQAAVPRFSQIDSSKEVQIVYRIKFFIMSTEFFKNISDSRHYCTDHKNGNDFFMSLVKWSKIAVKKSQMFQKFQEQKSFNFDATQN